MLKTFIITILISTYLSQSFHFGSKKFLQNPEIDNLLNMDISQDLYEFQQLQLNNTNKTLNFSANSQQYDNETFLSFEDIIRKSRG